MAKSKYTPTRLESEAISIIKKEFSAWQNEEVQVTDKVSFSMRDRIKQARKNYWGVFDKTYDPNGREKMWTHMTHNFTELFKRNIDVDTKDINVKAKKSQDRGKAQIARYVIRHFLDRLHFGEVINDFISRLCIDGTAVQKITKGLGSEIIKARNIDLLNIIIDPQADNIQKAPSVIERHVMTIDRFMEMPWDNKKFVMGRNDIKTYFDLSKKSGKTIVPEVVVYERWGKIPQSLITKRKADKDTWIEGVLIVSGVETGQTVVHKIVENPRKDKLRPYEESWFIKVPGRWYGVGIPELLFDIQEQLNENANMILNNSRVLQNKLFKTRQNSGITQQMLSRLSDGGVIPLKNINDLEELTVNDNRQGAYVNEERLYTWAQRVTGGFMFPGAGEPLPSTTTATTALLQQQNAKTSFDLVIENLGLALERMVERHWLPIIFQSISEEEVLRITGDAKSLEDLDEAIRATQQHSFVKRFITQEGRLPNQQEMELLDTMTVEKVKAMGEDRFIKSIRNDFTFEYDISVFVTNEKLDKLTVVSQIRQIIVELSQVPDLNLDLGELAKEMLDLMGFGGNRFEKKTAPAQVPQAGGGVRRAQQLPTERTAQQGQQIQEQVPV